MQSSSYLYFWRQKEECTRADVMLLSIDLCHHRLPWDVKRWVRMLLFGGFLQLRTQISKKKFPVSWTTKVNQLTMEPAIVQGYIMFSSPLWFNSFSCIFGIWLYNIHWVLVKVDMLDISMNFLWKLLVSCYMFWI